MTLRARTILVSALPLAFLLLLLALGLLILNRTVVTAGWSQHAEQVLMAADEVNKTLDAANQGAIDYTSGRASGLNAYRRAADALPAKTRALERLVAGEPAQLQRARRYDGLVRDGMTFLDRYISAMGAHHGAQARAMVQAPATRRLGTELQTARAALDNGERAETLARFNAARAATQWLGVALVVCCVAGILLTLFVSGRFGLSIARRLGRLGENARLLALGESSVPIGGGDEIAQLDRVYHELTRRIAREHYVASSLQNTLLPRELPTFPGLRIDTAYVPASKESEVGGDWYDVFTLPDERVAISVGDVSGHGLRAATIMASARLAIRTAARISPDPAHVLGHVNRVLCADEPDTIVTTVYGVLDRTSGTLRYAIAGHPPPIVFEPGGELEFLEGAGLVLGIDAQAQYEAYERRLAPGTRAVFYTDGIVEVDQDYFKGLDELAVAVRAESLDGAPNIAEAIQRRVLAGRRPVDDSALLFVALLPVA